MPRITTRIALAAACLLAAAPAAAQEASGTLPFRPGQWGAEFSATNSVDLLGLETDPSGSLKLAFPSLGFVKFRSNTSAWLLDGTVSYTSLKLEEEAPFGSAEGTNKVLALGVRAGLRSYRPLTGRALAFTSFGVTANVASGTEEEEGAPDELETSATGFGVFGELGGAYMVSPNLSLGASFGGVAGFSSFKQEMGDFSDTMSGFHIALGQTRLLVTLYF